MKRSTQLLTVMRGGAATPIPLTISGLWGWWDTSDISTLFQDSAGSTAVTASSDPVGMWKDKSGNARHFLQAGASSIKPSYQGAGGGIASDGGDYLTISGLSTTFTAETVIAVFMPTTTASNSRLFTQWASGQLDYAATGHYIPIMRNATNTTFGSYMSAVRSSVSVANDVKSLFISRHTGSALTNRANTVDGSAFTHTLNLTVEGMRLFADNEGAASRLTGRIYELLVFSTALSTTDRGTLETYLNAKWSVY